MRKAKILVIDDEVAFLDLVKEKLEIDGYEVLTAADGGQGLDIAKKTKPNLVICDIKMPNMDGFEVLKQVREYEGIKVPFIMLTALTDFDKIKQAYNGKADLYVTKPVEFSNLLKNIKILLSLAKHKNE